MPVPITLERILCPVDFSDFSRRALAHALALARWYEARVEVLHVVALEPAAVYAEYPGPMGLESVSAGPLSAELDRFVEPYRSRDVAIETSLQEGHIVNQILHEARAMPADLIVIGSHGRGGFERFVLGSVTEKVLRKATCRVLTVPPRVEGAPHEGPVVFSRILCPVDFSPSSIKALDYALSVAEEAGAELFVLHAIEGLHGEALTAYPDFNVARFVEQTESEALARLRQAIPDEARTWCTPHELVASGKAYEEILRVARERDIHLIVIGVHGRSAVNLMLFGSTTHQVVRQATCPVITLRAES